MSKKPHLKTVPNPKKQPASAPQVDFYKLNPSWRINQLEMSDAWSWHLLTLQEMADIRERLANFESMTWKDILITGSKQHHFVDVGSICQKARGRLEQIGLGDLERVVSLRVNSTGRIWGVMTLGVLTVLWWDPNHEICPTVLSHT